MINKKKEKIYCIFMQCQSEKQDFQVYPGKLGKYIYENISKEAWKKWTIRQTIIINEKKLNMLNLTDRNLLEEEMKRFLFKKRDD
ncbi:oxidative damage protection protein [Candidatus Schneideria nysicola]|uniref:oxidative damage protection protein n=1 Tax=Candidatus Schneideria nysicola TaxID=1081631 RepID=UPI001CAA43C5|nr:oxidative damage protection protein [Candidatus Schneideria nysicola]UAJ66116.1 oxidative damage protection protein [Candidatus Schneideria nysicola]